MRTSAVTAVLALVAVGCLSVGRPFNVGAVERIEIGVTTRDDVRRMFGAPWRTGLEDGDQTWTYGDYRYALFGTTLTRDLLVRFDEGGAVKSYTFSSSVPADADVGAPP